MAAGFQDASVREGFKRYVQNLEFSDADYTTGWKHDAFDLVLCHIPMPPRSGLLEDVFLSLRKRGTCVFIAPARISSEYLEKRLLAQAAGNTSTVKTYGLAPSLDEIRLMAPLMNNACATASLALYQPSLKTAKARKLVAYTLSRLGLAGIWTPYRIVVMDNGRDESKQGLRRLAEEHFGRAVEFALFTGTPGYLRKVTVQIMDTSGNILGYCKIGNSLQTKDVLQNEAAMLKLLSGLSLGRSMIPSLLFAGESHAGDFFLIQSARKGPLSSAPLTPGDIHVDFLTRLAEQTGREMEFLQSSCYREVAKRFTSVRAYADTDHYRRLGHVLTWLEKALSGKKMMLCVAHRDFTPWNTYISGGRLNVFDWEFSRRDWAPMTDAFHFIIQKGILVDRCLPDALWERLFSASSRDGRFIRQCAAATVVEKSDIPALFAFYLCDIVTMYLSHNGQERCVPPDGKILRETWMGLLGMVLSRSMADVS